MGAGLIVNPIKPSFNRQTREQSVLAPVSVRGCQIHRPTLVVEAVLGVVGLLVPALRHTEPQPRPLVHHGDSQGVQLLFTPLKVRTG